MVRTAARLTGFLRRGLVAVALLASGALCASAADESAVRGSDVERARLIDRIDAAGRRGFLYEVTPPGGPGPSGSRLFLYGTIHLGREGVEPFNLPVLDALRASSRLALEADPTDVGTTAQLAMELGQYGADDGLQRHVSPELMARVRAFGARYGMPSDRVVRFKPWLLANMVTVRQMNDSGLDADLGSELYLAGFAHATHMPIDEVEGLEAQLRLLAGAPDALQAAQLDEALDESNAVESRAESRALFDLWSSGDAVAGDTLVADMHRDAAAKLYERYFVDVLIDGRNGIMVDRVVRYLDGPGNTFFAVGALHLFGDTGLVRALARRGYRVVDLQAPADH